MVSSNYQGADFNTALLSNNQYRKPRNLDYFRNYYQNNKEKYCKNFPDTRKGDRHRLDRKTRYWTDFLKSENYQLTSIENIISQNVLSGGRESPYIALDINNKNLFFFRHYPSVPYYLEKQKDYLFAHLVWREKGELEKTLKERPRQFRKKWQEIKAKVEILSQWNHPTKLVPGYKENGRPRPTWEGGGWNSPNYWELKNRSLAALAFTHEIVLGKIGTGTPLLDLDPNKKDSEGNYRIKQKWLREALAVGGKKWKALINKYQIPYYWTTGTPGNSCLPFPFWFIGFLRGTKIYHQDTGQEVADLLACGDLVALPLGSDKNRQLVITEWGKKSMKKHGVEGIFRKKLLSGNIKEEVEKLLKVVFLTMNKPVAAWKSKARRDETRVLSFNQGKFSSNKLEQLEKKWLQVKVLSKQKTPLSDIWKIFYCSQQKQKGYFLLNDYHRPNVLGDLEPGSERSVLLVDGRKHQFFYSLG